MLETYIHLLHIDHMRTTLVIDDDVYRVTVHDAKALGQTVSEYVTEALRYRYPKAHVELDKDGLPLIVAQHGSRPITLEMIKEVEEQEDIERYAKRFTGR